MGTVPAPVGLEPSGLGARGNGGIGEDQGGGAVTGFGEGRAGADGLGDRGLSGVEEVLEERAIGLAVAPGAAAAARELLVIHLDQGPEELEGFGLAGGDCFHQPGNEVVEDLGLVLGG